MPEDRRLRVAAHVERLAGMLHEHLDLVKNVEALVAYVRAARGEGVGGLERELENLRSLRESIIQELTNAAEVLKGFEGEEALDLYSLAGYYLEAASLEERRVLESASGFLDVREDLGRLEEARRAARIIVEMLRERAEADWLERGMRKYKG